MKLYEFAPTRSIRARWTLQELGVELEAIPVNLMQRMYARPKAAMRISQAAASVGLR